MNDLIAASFNLKYKLKPITIQFYAVYSFLKYCISFESKIKDRENYQRNLLEFIIYYGHVWTKDNSYDFNDKAFVSLENENRQNFMHNDYMNQNFKIKWNYMDSMKIKIKYNGQNKWEPFLTNTTKNGIIG